MRRSFIKNGQFNGTNACFLGSDFISSGHWVLHKNYASNRRKFESTESTQKFLKDVLLVKEIDATFEELVQSHTINSPLKLADISDLSIGNGAIITCGDEIKTAQAQYINLLKQMLGPDDKLYANDTILVAYDAKNELGVMIMLYKMGDLLDSVRNRKAVKLVADYMHI